MSEGNNEILIFTNFCCLLLLSIDLCYPHCVIYQALYCLSCIQFKEDIVLSYQMLPLLEYTYQFID